MRAASVVQVFMKAASVMQACMKAASVVQAFMKAASVVQAFMKAASVVQAFMKAASVVQAFMKAASVVQIFKKVGWVATRLLLVPGILEAFFDGGLAVALFGMPPTFAFALGFILKAVGPALVIQCMFDVQQKRLGTAKSKFTCCYCADAYLTGVVCSVA